MPRPAAAAEAIAGLDICHLKLMGFRQAAADDAARIGANDPTTATLARIESAIDDTVKEYNNAMGYSAAASVLDAEKRDKYEDILAECSIARNAVLVSLQPILNRAPPPPGHGAAAGPGRFQHSEALRPAMLEKTATPEDLRSWLINFRAYYEATNMASLRPEQQAPYFWTNVDPELARRLRPKADVDTPVLVDPMAPDDLTLEKILADDFLISYPIHSRRMQFFRQTQPKGCDHHS